MELLTIFVIGVSLSMDAFSLSLAYGTLGINKKEIIKLSSIVGIYHFFMPLLGSKIGSIIFNYIKISSNIVVFLILFFIGINLIRDSFEKSQIDKKNNFFNLLLFGFAVSLDSFSVGIGLESITSKHIDSSVIFMSCSFFFTLLGLFLGKKINQLLGKIATLIGGIMLLLLSITYLF